MMCFYLNKYLINRFVSLDLCPNGYEDFLFKESEYCYFFGARKSKWLVAREKCIELGGDLATPTQEQLDQLYSVKARGFWLGFHLIGGMY